MLYIPKFMTKPVHLLVNKVFVMEIILSNLANLFMLNSGVLFKAVV